MKKAVLPFLTIPEGIVTASPWAIELSTGRGFTDPDFIEEWDNGTDIKLQRTIEVNFDECLAALRCPADETELAILVSIGTGAGSIPVEKWIYPASPVNAETPTQVIDLEVSGEHLADVLHVETAIILAESVANPLSPISPIHEGSVVWQEKKRVRLEGDVSRFPVSETNLESLLGAEWKDALWYLQVDWEEPGAPFDSAVRLHVNSLQREFANRFQKGDPETVHAVMADVITQITSGCLNLGDEWELVSEEIDGALSLGQVAFHWLVSAFGTIEAARQTYTYAPGKFNAYLNALAAQEGDRG